MEKKLIEFCKENNVKSLYCKTDGIIYEYYKMDDYKFCIIENGVIEYRKYIEVYDLNLNTAFKLCCNLLKVTSDELKTKSRCREIVFTRQLIHYILRLLNNKSTIKASLAEIGRIAGNKDHATVLHSCKTIENLITTKHGNTAEIVKNLLNLFIDSKIEENDKELV